MMPGDFRDLAWMLVHEDEGEGALNLTPANTFIVEDEKGIIGFFMMIIEQGLPSLRYFVVKKNRRSMKTSRAMIKKYQEFVRNRGFKASFIVVKKKYLKRVVEYYFKRKPYATKDNMYFYLVEV